MTPHPFDTACTLQHAGGHRFTGATSPGYANMVGPFGGITAAQMLAAVLAHPDCLGEPAALTVNFAAAIADGPFAIDAVPVRTNRSTQHWQLTMTQGDGVLTTGSAVTAVRRPVFAGSELPVPAMPAPATVPQATLDAPLAWLQRYELRPVQGGRPQFAADAPAGGSSLTQLWVRDAVPRALDAPALAAMADVFFPRIWLHRPRQVPAGTVTLTTYFHAGADTLASAGTGYLLGQARGQVYGGGFFDQQAQLWSEAGTPLATSHQLVYYKA